MIRWVTCDFFMSLNVGMFCCIYKIFKSMGVPFKAIIMWPESIWCTTSRKNYSALKYRDFTSPPNSGLYSLLLNESECFGHSDIMIKWLNQLIITKKCHWIQNSWVILKEGAIILANPIKSIIRLLSHIFFPM